MSHVADLQLEVKDLDSLEKACNNLGLELVRNQTTFKHFAGRTSPCTHAIRVKGNAKAYEIGLVANGDVRKGFTLQWDSYAGGYGIVEKVGGKDGGKLKQAYGNEVARKYYQKKGYRVSNTTLEDGRVVLTATK